MSIENTKYVYKILPNSSFFQGIPVPVPASFEIKPTDVDARDGYIHMSTVAQLGGTLDKFFTSDADRVVQLLKVDIKRLSAFKIVKWEASRDGALFPHLYGTLEGEYIRDLKLVDRKDHGWEAALGFLVEEGWLEN